LREAVFAELAALARNAAEGDGAAMSALLKVLETPLRQFLERRLSGPYAEGFVADALQETRLRIFLHVGSCEARTAEQFMGWCLAIARNCAKDQLRQIATWRVVQLDRDPAGAEQERQIDGRAAPTALKRAYESLAPDTQYLIWLRVVCGASWAEAAGALGISRDAAKRRYQRARARLQRVGA
jgi:RNA polymerase sigma factor (sigma-70 family)